MRPLERTERQSVHVGMLRKQNLLQDVPQEYRATGATASQVRFGPAEHRDVSSNSCDSRAEPHGDGVASFLGRGVDCAFAGAARAYLYSSHLIRRA